MAKGLAMLLGEEEGGASEKEEAAQDLIDAVKSGDAKAVVLAFEALYEHCSMGHGEPDEDDSEDEKAYGGTD